MKKLLIALIILVIIAAGFGYYMYNKPLSSTSSMSTEFTMQAGELLEEFENDEEKANASYLDKVIEITGKIQKVESKNGTTSIYLDSDNPLSSVIFQLEEPNSTILEGQLITLKGICTGYLMDVVLVRAVKL